MRQLPSYGTTSTKKELLVVEYMDQRLHSHVRPQTPVTYEQDNCRANTPTDKDKDSCQYAYEYDPVAGIILLPERPRR